MVGRLQPSRRVVPNIRLTAPARNKCQGLPVGREHTLIVECGIIGQALKP
jgi:hypothetical protein